MDIDVTPNKPPPAATAAQPSSVQRVFNYLNDFKDRAFGTPQSQNTSVASNPASPALGGQSASCLASPLTPASAAGLQPNPDKQQPNSSDGGQQLTPNSRGQALLGMMKGFFVPDKSDSPSSQLDTPMRNTVADIAHSFPQTHGANTDNYCDNDITNSGLASPGESGDDTIDRIKKDNKMRDNRASLSTNYGSFVSTSDQSKLSGAGDSQQTNVQASPTVVTIDDTPNCQPKNKFLAKALIKAKKGTPDSPICLDSPVGITGTDDNVLSGTPRSSKTPNNVMKSAGKQTPNRLTSSKEMPSEQSENSLHVRGLSEKERSPARKPLENIINTSSPVQADLKSPAKTPSRS